MLVYILAWAEIRMILVHVLQNLDFELQHDNQNWITSQKDFTLWERPRLNLKLSLYKEMPFFGNTVALTNQST